MPSAAVRARVSFLCLAASLGTAGRAQARSPYESLARELTSIARHAGYARLAVLPLNPASGGRGEAGKAIAERLISQLVSQTDVQVVERSLLDQVIREQKLGYQGVLDPSQAKQVGRVLGVDALVSGSFLTLSDGRIEVHARLLDAETARVMGAATSRVAKEWQDDFFGGSDVMNVLPPDIGAFPEAPRADDLVREAIAGDSGCSGWEERMDRLQSSVIEFKARHWAAKLREPGFSPRGLSRNPGSEIRSVSLRHDFYGRVRELYDEGYRGTLSARERELLDYSERAAERLREDCYR